MSYTRMTVGNPKLSAAAPRGARPCSPPYVTGLNILRDPGFENHLINVLPGPDDEAFPGEIGAGALPWPLFWAQGWPGGLADRPATGWAVFTNNGVSAGPTDNRWVISTASPRSGNYHARYARPKDIPDGGVGPVDLIPVGVSCDCVIHSTYGVCGVQSARIEPGDFTRFQCWAKSSNTVDTEYAYIYCQIWNADYSTKLYENGNYYGGGIGTSYGLFEHSVFAPAGAYWVTWYIDLGPVSGATVAAQYDVDDCVLEIS